MKKEQKGTCGIVACHTKRACSFSISLPRLLPCN